ncbi:murein L,D-transpeptidase catalytic domain family protein [Belliella sp. R4-6]|uniref:Murein L,D-transpeptidase catalytic domain family protein n=1 Tax=Belliella alkalica TaxID=1730871 RepID=A0ABS9VCR2_9BACT|nr:murein L,D-transpeptidase catalytic domain family protein [Belliella alkalica]MCH7414227.1 murein L,D-transpeptidase catalytic domain family protein [Belliella alkalica]
MLIQTITITFILFIGIFPNPKYNESNKPTSSNLSIENQISEIYQQLYSFNENVPSEEVFSLALNGWLKLNGDLNSKLLTVIDFSLPSTEKRLWIIDPENRKVLLNSVVSHGRNSGGLIANEFSNQPESFKSSLGFYKTAETYAGKHGYSLRLDGLEIGFNDQARNRAIVIHGAEYAREEFAATVGRLGRSLGCPALPTELSTQAINLIKDGSLLFIFANDLQYLNKSRLIQA